MSDTKQKGLKQDDFRKLLQTPRPSDTPAKGILGVATPKYRAIQAQTPKASNNSFAKSEILPPPSSKTKRRFKKPEISVETINEKYRDRAAERRKGDNPDYKDTEQILEALNNNETLEAKLAYEQSKYLGGDAEHTHLVKGLDYALLTKLRNEMYKGENEVIEEESEMNLLQQIQEESEDTPRIKSKLAQNIYDAVIVEGRKIPPKYNELFVAGRMAYVFELADENGNYGDPFAIPTTIIRSKADVGDASGADKSTNDLVIEKISRVMAIVRKEVKMVKLAAIDDSEDIFADAGRDYKVLVNNEDSSINKKEDVDTLSYPKAPSSFSENIKNDYFDKEQDLMEIDQKEEVQNLKSLIDNATSVIQNNDNNNLLKNELITENKPSKSEIIKKKFFGQDSYDGDYSTYGLGISSLGGARESAYDSGHSDSDSDGTGIEHTIRDQGVTKNKKAQLSRWDFDTEEEWQAYKDNVTAMPKSAFQFGVKTGDGRKTRRSGKELTEKQKLDRDWQKISKIMEKKYGSNDGIEEVKEATKGYLVKQLSEDNQVSCQRT
ncbi:4251_t:CDS:2 [Entrophospora sp. SA101]|nr:4251_t:CDS:2 [Entrophospora sp. SA101]